MPTGRRSGLSIMPVVVSLLVLLAGAAQATSVTLAWSASPDASVTGYRIYYGATAGGTTNRVEVGPALTCTVSNLVAGTNYFFFATAYDGLGVESEPSNTITYTPTGLEKPEKPLQLRRAGFQRRQPGAQLVAHLEGTVSRLLGGDQFGPQRHIVGSEFAQALGIARGQLIDRFHQSAQGGNFVLESHYFLELDSATCASLAHAHHSRNVQRHGLG